MGIESSSSSRVISTAAILSTTVIISNLLLSATTAAAYSFWPYHHVHVTNELTGGKVLLVHCKSGTRDLGVQNITPTNEFTWRFRPGFLFVSTLFWCYIAPDGGRHIHFDAWTDHVSEKYEYGYSISWVAKDDGLYVRIPKKGDQYWQMWDQGRMEK
ncbi:unnamed protein product [Linum trigynum]|uniref:S-protein homolog n=1 Tax=Linum trigynum TaxID=586398 RepID=A0AAV2GDG1_9ROSI